MEKLAVDGLIRREPGRGSFVVRHRLTGATNRLMTFTQEMLRAGRVPSSRLLTRVIRPSSTTEAASLAIPARQPIVHLRRLRQADNEPIALESSILIGACADAVMTADLAHGHSTRPWPGPASCCRAGTDDHRRTASAEEARLLGIRTGDPLLVERRVILDERDREVEVTESVYSADRYALEVQFRGRGPGRRSVRSARLEAAH